MDSAINVQQTLSMMKLFLLVLLVLQVPSITKFQGNVKFLNLKFPNVFFMQHTTSKVKNANVQKINLITMIRNVFHVDTCNIGIVQS